MLTIKPYLNRLLEDPSSGLFWTVERKPHVRLRPFTLLRAEDVRSTVGSWPYTQQVKRPVREFQPFETDLSEVQALERLKRWNLQPVEINNGYPAAYQAIYNEAIRRGLPRDYRTDLTVHDLNHLCSPGWATDEFLWILRTNGTFIINLKVPVALDSGNHPVAVLKAAMQFGDSEMYYYLYRDGKLTEVSPERAKTLAADAMQATEQHEREQRRKVTA